jgi:hypothetical protein
MRRVNRPLIPGVPPVGPTVCPSTEEPKDLRRRWVERRNAGAAAAIAELVTPQLVVRHW